jgi:HAD superfamily hydrolase (TIGR01509 family)
VRIGQRRHWIFDLDGTLTVAMHDFASFKRAHGLPLDRPILEALVDRQDAAEIHVALRLWEEGLADQALPADGAAACLAALAQRGCSLGILTRNTRAVALRSLQATGLRGYFREETVVGRDEAAHKPSPDGVLLLLAAWGARPDDAVMVGDFRMDVEAGRSAGVATVYVWDGGKDPQVGQDLRVNGLVELVSLLD